MFHSIFREYTYDSWGNITGVYDQYGNEITNPNDIAYQNPLRYRSYYYDDETGLYYLNSRYYNPEWGTFICADGYVSTGEQIVAKNMYAYCLNNPVNYADPSGRYTETEILAIDIATIIACLAFIVDYAEKNDKPIAAVKDFWGRAIGDKATISEAADTLTIGVNVLKYGSLGLKASAGLGSGLDLVEIWGSDIGATGQSATVVGLLVNTLTDFYNPLISNNELSEKVLGHIVGTVGEVGIATFSVELAVATTALSGNPAVGIALGLTAYGFGKYAWDKFMDD